MGLGHIAASKPVIGSNNNPFHSGYTTVPFVVLFCGLLSPFTPAQSTSQFPTNQTTPAKPPIAPGTPRKQVTPPPSATPAQASTANGPQVLQLPQALEFESGGLKYKALTRGNITVIVAPLPTRLLGYAIVQVSISNASVDTREVESNDFEFQRMSGPPLGPSGGNLTSPPTAQGAPTRALSADNVVTDVLNRASSGDVGRLITVYEAALFNNAKAHSTNGYEARRKYAMAMGNTRMRAASAAAAIVLGRHSLSPGESTDGAVFFPNSGRPLGYGRLQITIGDEAFSIDLDPITTK
ncbi:MAG: hypothetical protein ABI824_11875 [Acidobacteriota bacterium]